MKRIFRSLGVAGSAWLLLGAVQAAAVPITYTISGVGSGTFGPTAFVDALVTVTSTGDTGSVIPISDPVAGFSNRLEYDSIVISVAGVGEGYLIAPEFPFPTIQSQQDIHPAPAVVIYAWDVDDFGKPILATLGALHGYDLSTEIAVTGNRGFHPNEAVFGTTFGNFSYFDMGDTTFTASIANAVPIPPAIALFASSLGLLGLLGWRRKKQQTPLDQSAI